MRKVLLGLFCIGTGWSQLTYTVSKTTALSAAAEVVTVQQPNSSSKRVNFVSAFMDSTAACTAVIERNGAAATSTSLTPASVNTGQSAASSAGFHTSNVGVGTVVTRISVPAGGGVIVDLTRIFMNGNGNGQNLTVRTGTCTGTVDIVITYTES